MGFQYLAEYRIFHCSIRPNTITNSCWTEKENERKSITCKTCSVLHITYSALVVSSSHTANYFHSKLCRLSIIRNNYGSVKIHAVMQFYSTRTDQRSADYSIDQGRAPHVSMEAMQSTSRPAADEAFSGTHLTTCDLHCSGATAAWHAMLIMLRGVTGGPTMSHSLEIWCPIYGPAVQWGWGYTLQYYSQDNSRASTDCESLMCYMRMMAHWKHFKPRELHLWRHWLSVANYSYLANFWLHYLAEYE